MAFRVLCALVLGVLAVSCDLVADRPGSETTRIPITDIPLVSEQAVAGRVRLSETVTRRLYGVEGASEQEIRASLSQRGPSAAGAGGSAAAGRFDGLTDWQLRWSFRYQREGGSCSLAGATIDLSIVVLLPELRQPETLAPDLLARWQAYVAALETHEMGHVERQRAIARDLAAALDASLPAATCSDLGQQLSALGEAHLQTIRVSDASYDVETNHGLTQGAFFP
jgi:predicted secreted Zn-dependent protease